MEAAVFFEKLVQTVLYHMVENNIYNHHYENLKSHILLLWSSLNVKANIHTLKNEQV
jgi:hypothetical protein